MTRWLKISGIFLGGTAACFGVIVVIAFAQNGWKYSTTVQVPRRDYMTVEELSKIHVGMTDDEFINAQEAKPMENAEPVGDQVEAMYYLENDKSDIVMFTFKKQKDGKVYVTGIHSDSSKIGATK